MYLEYDFVKQEHLRAREGQRGAGRIGGGGGSEGGREKGP
jgi:hypothetical protein